MKKIFNKKILALLPLVAALLVVPHVTEAWSFVSVAYDVLTSSISSIFEIFILPLAAGILYLAGYIMDQAIQFSLHTAYIFSLSPAINLGWSIIRDFANMLFIFILIYISLGTIVQGTGGFKTKQLLTHVIIAALLINFSLFITKAVIDVSNIFGNWLYGGVQNVLIANTQGCSNTSNAQTLSNCAEDHTSISGLITARLGILNFWSSATTNANGAGSGFVGWNDPSTGLIGAVLRLMVVLIATYIFLYCAVLFISRSITLLFLLVFSPVGFLGGVLPQIKKYATEWREELSNAAIFPVAFLLMLYIALQFVNSLDKLSLSAMGTVKVFGMDIQVSQYFQYFLIIFLLKATLSLAKKYSGEMGQMLGGMAEGLGKVAVNAAIGLGSGGAGILGRSIIGRTATNLAGSATFQDYASGVKGNRFTQFVSQRALKGTVAVSKSSFDVRGSKTFKDTMKGVTGLDTGKPVLSYDAKKKDIEKKETEFGKLLGKGPEGEARRAAYGEKLGGQILYNITGSGKLAEKVGEDMTEKAQKGYDREVINKLKKDLFKLKVENRESVTQIDKDLEREQALLDSMDDVTATSMPGEVQRMKDKIESLKKQRANIVEAINKKQEEIKEKQKEFKLIQKIEPDDDKGGKKDKEEEDEDEKKGDKK